ncbi:hypothetical protein [Methylobacterium isbiliense]|uniref:Uncharacterized protein n=1 Tax=Methylobacterium isbiliense TaxID=315478 RepID=A0ABQ4SDM3_9HYPH|nr:hypothetical protein [Methylobacterium isbiliense]MDN3627424.1 hypothetical protein [Methylobacterium isbiliense]GJE00649.1 hypothetical protein GMJLKIPL_2573 [Methylobacterium isbiliense]
MGVHDWDLVPARNATADPTIRATDGASQRDVFSSLRAMMAATRALADDQGGALVSEGTDNVYVISTASGLSELRPGLMISFWADRDNTDEPFLNVSGTGPRRWRGADGLSLPAGSVQRGLLYTVTWTGGLDGLPLEWRSVGAASAAPRSAGVSFDHSGSPAERAQYDAAPKGTTFLSVADTPQGPS